MAEKVKASPKSAPNKRRTRPVWWSLKRFLLCFVMKGGDFSANKTFYSLGSAIVGWWMVRFAETILKDWTTALAISAVLVGSHTVTAVISARNQAAK